MLSKMVSNKRKQTMKITPKLTRNFLSNQKMFKCLLPVGNLKALIIVVQRSTFKKCLQSTKNFESSLTTMRIVSQTPILLHIKINQSRPSKLIMFKRIKPCLRKHFHSEAKAKRVRNLLKRRNLLPRGMLSIKN